MAEGLPLYARIEARLREAIAKGRHPVGELLPTEAELCASHRVSRHTIREALRRLAEAGLVERRQGSGSLVIAREPSRGEVHAIPSIDGLRQYAADTRLLVRSRGVAPLTPEEAAQTLGAAGEPWLKLEGLRVGQDGRPLATASVLIAPRFVSIETDLPERGAIYRAIEDRFGVQAVEVVQEITAGPMPPAIAAPLKRRARDIGMHFLRRYVEADGRTMIVSRSWHPAERFTYAMRLKSQKD
ncbi:GntR family transcriptional regulator [Falsiroseomonas sp. HW251]|uniref:GntR family transcriptional regulator n=1 Tax=Falsiroseomonas sp. HW251 TaxID=3390998 RepID=UPI003D3199DC